MKKLFYKISSVIMIVLLTVFLFVGCSNTNTYTVSFDSMGGTTIDSQTVKAGELVKKPSDPQKEGFTFVEWQLNDESYDFNLPVSQDITLAAFYKIKEGTEIVSITLDYQNGQENKTVEIIKGGQLVEPLKPQKAGYKFVGWYINEEKFDFSTSISENITLTAKWNKNKSENTSNKTSVDNTTSESENNTDSVGTDNTDTSYLIFEKQGGGYCVTGIAGNGPKNIIIPATYEGLPVIKIGDAAGINCSNIHSIKIPNSITHIDSRAFWECTSLDGVIIPNSVTTVGDSAFYQCANLTSVTMSNKVTVIADDLFGWCSNLSKVNIPNGVTSIGNTSFVQCKKLRSITLPSSLTKIENNAFEGSGLTTITIPNSVNKLGYCVFANCKNMTSVTIGKGIANIPDGTFTGCTSLTSITFKGTKAQWKNVSLGNDWNGSVPATKVTCSDGTISLNGNTGHIEPTPSNPTPSEPQSVRVNGVKLDKTSLSLMVGDTQQLTATVSPSNADNKNVAWTTSNSSVAQISSSGKITAKGKGSATITVTTNDGGYKATCTVTVKEKTTTIETPVYTDVLIISDTRTISNQTINTDVYITSTGVATFNNVTVNGNVYCYGQLIVSGGSANNLYAYYWNLGGITSSCNAWDGTHGLVKGAFRTCGDVVIKDNALNNAFNKWGKK